MTFVLSQGIFCCKRLLLDFQNEIYITIKLPGTFSDSGMASTDLQNQHYSLENIVDTFTEILIGQAHFNLLMCLPTTSSSKYDYQLR